MELRAQRSKHSVRQLANRSQRMIRGDPLLQQDVTEHPICCYARLPRMFLRRSRKNTLHRTGTYFNKFLEPIETHITEVGSPDSEIFEFVYQGPDVNSGTMDAREMADVLTGMSRAFSTVAYEEDLGDRYQLRVKDIEANSFHLIFEAIGFARANPAAATAIAAGTAVLLNAATNAASGAYRVVTDIAKLIDAKKRQKGQGLQPCQRHLTRVKSQSRFWRT